MDIKKVLLLGGSGFVGTYIANRLSQRGVEVTIPTRRRERTKALIIQPNVEMPEVNINSEEVLVELMRGKDVVINLVGILHSPGLLHGPGAAGRLVALLLLGRLPLGRIDDLLRVGRLKKCMSRF